MKPGIPGWATNANWAGGPSAGSPTKAPPTAGQRAEGYYPTYRPAPQVIDYLIWELGIRASGLASARALNWIEIDTSGIGDTGGPIDGVHDPITGSDVIVDFTGALAFEDNTAPGGMIWAAGAGGAGMAGNVPRLAVDHLGNIAFVNQVACPPGLLGVAYSPTPLGGWVAWPGGGAPAGSWVRIAHDWLGRWVIGDAAGAILQSTAPAIAFAAVTVNPGFPNAIYCLRHSHHPAGLIWPADPGNQSWIALSPTRASRSADGMTWTAAALHGLPGFPLDLAYSAFGALWIAPLVDVAGAFQGLGWSIDNGATWNAAAPFATSLANPIGIDGARIACDGYGDWAVALTDGTTVELWVSWDNGVTWTLVHLPSAPHPNDIALWYGGGRFHLMTTDAAAAWAGYASLRADE